MSQRDNESDGLVYKAVVNQEEQYSIWPVDKDLPAGWKYAGKEGKKEECLAFIEEGWTDMRPLSLRRTLETPTRTG